jgi:hypothetical protein
MQHGIWYELDTSALIQCRSVNGSGEFFPSLFPAICGVLRLCHSVDANFSLFTEGCDLLRYQGLDRNVRWRRQGWINKCVQLVAQVDCCRCLEVQITVAHNTLVDWLTNVCVCCGFVVLIYVSFLSSPVALTDYSSCWQFMCPCLFCVLSPSPGRRTDRQTERQKADTERQADSETKNSHSDGNYEIQQSPNTGIDVVPLQQVAHKCLPKHKIL